MKQIETEIIINAKPEIVWEILTDFDNYGKWNPFIKSISGMKEEGEQLKVFIQPPEGKGMTFKPLVLNYQENSEFRWIGKLGIKGIFDGEHYFKLEEISPIQTKFIQGEKFTGILVVLMRNLVKNTKRGFEIMNKALKKEAEQKK